MHLPTMPRASTASCPSSLQGEQRADVCIVGGGFSGLNTAIELAERGLSVILLEAHCIGWAPAGATAAS